MKFTNINTTNRLFLWSARSTLRCIYIFTYFSFFLDKTRAFWFFDYFPFLFVFICHKTFLFYSHFCFCFIFHFYLFFFLCFRLASSQPVRSIQLNRHAFANGVIQVQKGLYVHEPTSQMYPLSEEDSMTSPGMFCNRKKEYSLRKYNI